MGQWHEHKGVQVVLRMVGLMLLVSAWNEGRWLNRLVLAHPARDATPAQMLIAAVIFVSASAGMMLAIVGAGLWERVRVSDRWAGCEG